MGWVTLKEDLLWQHQRWKSFEIIVVCVMTNNIISESNSPFCFYYYFTILNLSIGNINVCDSVQIRENMFWSSSLSIY